MASTTNKNKTEELIACWAQRRREEIAADPGFADQIMRQIHATAAQPDPDPDLTEPVATGPAPRPLTASLCLCAGIGKLALLIHLAF